MRQSLVGFVAGVVATLLVAVALWLGVVYSGAYDVAASDPHADLVRWSFDTTMRRSVAARAGADAAPESQGDDALRDGARLYAGSCVHCHGAPGAEPAEWSRGMRPEPPRLVEAAAGWSPGEIRWIVTNGLKMTGMPSFATRHDAVEIGAIAAFVAELPGLSPADYSALTAGTGAAGHGGG
jgi:mono/diheme cytochrome c family protein